MTFEDKAWEEIGEGLPPESGIGASHDAGGDETPAAGETPAEGGTEEAH
jgi:hypothetical protein